MLLAILAMTLLTCGGGGGGTDLGTGTAPTPTPAPAKSVVITGTVPGTVAIAYYASTGMEAARSVASGTPKTFSLNVDPGAYYLMFITNEGAPTQRSFAFRNVTGGNVFTCKANTTLDLGALVFNNYPGTAVPLNDPITGNDGVAETFMPEAIFSPGPGEWIETRKYVNSTCPGHSPGTTVTGDVKIAQGFGIVTYTPAGTTETAIGVANVNTAILTASGSALVTIDLTMQSDGSLAGTYSKAGYGGECSEDATITAVLRTSPPPPPPAATLTGLSINGPTSIAEYGTATYTATATWSNKSPSTVTPTWSVDSRIASISPFGVFSGQGGIASDQAVTITATYSYGEITQTATKGVTVTNFTGIPNPLATRFEARMLSRNIFFKENVDAGRMYESSLFVFNADSSFREYRYKNPPDTSESVNGTWSIGASGEAILGYVGGNTVTWKLIGPSFWTTLWISVDNGTGTPSIVILEISGPGPYPFDGSLIRGTYVNQYGDTWIFNSSGTGSTTGGGGSAFNWSVDAGILKVVFPNGHVGWMYQIQSENTWTDYPVMRWAFVLTTTTGDYYYGGMKLTRQ